MMVGLLILLRGLAVSAAGLDLYSKDGPPPGPTDEAWCPVTGKHLTITSTTPAVEFQNGQKLYFASDAMAQQYKTNPRAFILSPHELPLAAPDGMRGLPDLRGTTLLCPFSGEDIHVSMQSLRVDHRYGQAVYFCCNGCLTNFWADPQSAFATGDSLVKSANWLMEPPPGPSDIAFCPVTNTRLNITENPASFEFTNGQKIYFANKQAAEAFQTNPRAFALSPFEQPLGMPDGGRGVPDLRGTTLYCPYSGEEINVAMQSVRVTLRHGQAIYFCCHGCLTRYWTSPETSWAGEAGFILA